MFCNLTRYFALYSFLSCIGWLSTSVLANSVSAVEAPVRFFVSPNDFAQASFSRRDYERDVLLLALDKTRDEGDNYVIDFIDESESSARELHLIKKHTYKNFIRTFSINEKNLKDPKLAYFEFPVMLGQYGYRVCLASLKTQETIRKFTDNSQFLHLSHVQGVDWMDADILRAAGLKVYTTRTALSMLKMVERNRADLYCLGLMEVDTAIKVAEAKGINVYADDQYLLHYFMPRYFFVNVKDKPFLDRIQRGVLIAYEDGSLKKIWDRYFLNHIKANNIEQRKVIRINNSVGDQLSLVAKYLYRP